MKDSLFIEEEGRGPVLVFIHGFCETHEVWTEFKKNFTKEFRVVTVDLPGFGKSPSLKSPFTVDEVANEVADALHAKNISDSLIIGHSLGGYVTLSLLANHPDLMKGIALFHSSAFADTPEKRENRNKVIEFVKKNGVPPFLETFVPGLFFDKKHPRVSWMFEQASKVKAASIQNYSAAMRDRPDRSSLWNESAITKLLIAGIEDSTIPIKISEDMARSGKNVTFHKLEKTGHMGFFEAEERSSQAIKRFAYQLFNIN